MEGKYFVLVINPTVITAFGKINECKQCVIFLSGLTMQTRTHTHSHLHVISYQRRTVKSKVHAISEIVLLP